MGRHQLSPRSRCAGDDADMDSGTKVALGEVPAQVDVARLAGGTLRLNAAGAAAEPRIEYHPLTDVEPRGGRSHGHHFGDHLVPRHVRERRERRHRVVHVTGAEVAEDQLGIGTTDPREDGSRDHPVRSHQPGIVHVVQAEGQARQHRFQFIGGGGPDLLRGRRGPKEQRFHGAPSGSALSVMALIPIMKLSKSVVFISITAFMSGR